MHARTHTQSEMANDLPKFFFRSVFIFFIIFPLFLVGSKEKESKIKMVTAPRPATRTSARDNNN